MSFPYLAKTTLKYKSPHATDLSFAKDETIRVTGQSEDDEDWLLGESMDGSRSGGFPRDFVTQIEEEAEDVAAPVTEETDVTAPPTCQPVEAVDEPAPAPPPASVDAQPPPSPKLDPKSLPQSPAPSQPPSTTSANPPPTALAATSPVTEAPAPTTAEGDEPSHKSMKDRLAFFTAAQGKAGPPPPVKPKPASGGLTWSQRQKLKQEQEAKEREAGGGASVDPATSAAPAPASPAVEQPPSPQQEKKEGSGMSAADAQSSIGKGGSLKERMAALQGAGAFGKSDEPKPAPPAPSGKVWKRPPAPPAPEPEVGEETEAAGGENIKSPVGEEGDALNEAGEEQTEEEAEKARKAAIAARMAKLGARGPMGMPPPPKPTRKPTKEALASPSTEEKPTSTLEAATDSAPTVKEEASEPTAVDESKAEPEPTSPPAATSPPTSVPMPAIARRTAPPRRRGPPSSNAAPTVASTRDDPPEAENRFESIGPGNGAEPPPQVMVYDEEKPLPKTDEEIAMDKEYEAAGKSSGGAEGAEAAGIAMAPVESKDGPQEAQKQDERDPVVGAMGGAGEVPRGSGIGGAVDAGDVIDGQEGEPAEVEEGLKEGGQEKDGIMREAQAGGVPAASKQEPEMVPLHSPAESPMLDDAETPPPPPPRMTMSDMPKDEIEMKHPHSDPTEEEDDDEEQDAPPPPPQRDARRSIGGGEKPMGPRPLPSPGRAGAGENAALPPPPIGSTMVPPRDDSEDEREADGAGDEEDEEEEDEAPPPPPPARKPSMPLQIATDPSAAGPGSPRAAASAVPQSPMSPKRSVPPPPAPATEDASEPRSPEDEEATRRSNIAARMAKLGGIKFGAPPPVPTTKRSMSTDPSREVEETANPKSPIRDVSPPPTQGGEEGETERDVQQRTVSPPVEATDDGEETPEQEAARRRATLARLRAGGSLGFGMFGQGGPKSAASPSDERGLEQDPVAEDKEEEVQEGQPPAPPGRPAAPAVMSSAGDDGPEDGEEEGAAPPPPPPGRPGTHSRSPTADLSAGDGSAPPPPARPPVPGNRPMPPPPVAAATRSDSDDEPDAAAVPPPPPRPTQSPALPPQSPASARPPIPTDKRSSMSQLPPPPPIRTDLPPPPVERQMTEEPSAVDADAPAPPPPPPPGRPPQTPSSPSPRRSTSIASRSSGQPPMTPASRQGSRMEEPPRSSISSGRPGFNDLQEASKQHGSRLIRAAKAMFQQGKQAYFGDGSPAGFVLVAMDNAHLPRPQNQWGYVVLEQEGSTVLKRSDEPRPGDIAAFYDAKLKGKKGLSSYSQNVGSVEEPLVGVISESETKKHKLRVLQVERGVPEEVSYRCDDLKSGRVVVFRPGV